jgi:exopolyphosphatase/guanosine-5'-triphosphate,3'-diphosphate pyrophosphatase
MGSVRSSIDLGTNTCLMLVVDPATGGEGVGRVLADYSTIVRLGQDVDRTGLLHPDAIERTLACLRDYADKLRSHGGKPEATMCVSTASARDARNGAEFFERVKRETGFGFQVISGEEEGRLTFLGALLPDLRPERSVVIDIGGGSTELIALGRDGKTTGPSLQMGSVRFTERFLKSDPVTDDEFWACQDEADRLFESLRSWRSGLAADARLVGVAGTVTTLAAWHLELGAFDARRIDEVTLTRGDVHRMVEELKWRTVEERRGLTGIESKRADVLLAGALILWRAMEVLGFADLRVSTRGLRYGVLRAPS